MRVSTGSGGLGRVTNTRESGGPRSYFRINRTLTIRIEETGEGPRR